MGAVSAFAAASPSQLSLAQNDLVEIRTQGFTWTAASCTGRVVPRLGLRTEVSSTVVPTLHMLKWGPPFRAARPVLLQAHVSYKQDRTLRLTLPQRFEQR